MTKSAVYSWRVDPELLATLAAVARREQCTVATLLDRMAGDWLAARPNDDDGEQARLHATAEATLGAIRGGKAERAEQARATLRAKLAKRRRHAA